MRNTRFRPTAALVTCVLALAAVPAQAAWYTWPGPSCGASLQACVDAAAAGDVIEIATNAPIAEDIELGRRSLTLGSAPGYEAAFGSGHSLRVSSASGSPEVTLHHLRLSNGMVDVHHSGSGSAKVVLRRLIVTNTASAPYSAIRVDNASGILQVRLEDNHVTARGPTADGGLVWLSSRGGSLSADLRYNRVTRLGGAEVDGAGILAGATQGGRLTAKLHANVVHGRFVRGGIVISEGRESAATPSVVDANLYNNAVVGAGGNRGMCLAALAANGTLAYRAVNNTAASCEIGLRVLRWAGGSSGEVSGILVNNVLQGTQAARVDGGLAPALGNHHNLFDGALSGLTPGADSILGAAGFSRTAPPRLAADSPALEAGDGASLLIGLIANGFPALDGDGLRRVKAAGASAALVDMGAYEHGDVSLSHVTSAASITDHMSRIDDPRSNGRPALDMVGAVNYSGVGAAWRAWNRPWGVWYPAPYWSIYDQGRRTMPEGIAFNLFAPARGVGAFRHTVTAANLAGNASKLDGLDDRPDDIVLVLPNWEAGSIYDTHPLGVFSFGPSVNSWYVAHLDNTPMAAGVGFSVYSQAPSPNAFRVIQPATSPQLKLDHPLLNGQPCARFVATRHWDGSAVTDFWDTYYEYGRWSIYDSADEAIPAGTQFHVLVDPAQVAECSDVIFQHGFEGAAGS